MNPLFIQFAQDVRGYSLALLLVSASCFFFVRGIQQVDPPPRFCWTAYTIVTALAAYTNFWAALVPSGAGALTGLPAVRDAIPWRRIVTSAVALVVLLVPLGLLIQATDSAGVNWASGSSAGRLFTHIRSSVPHAVLDGLVLVAVVVVVAAIVLARRRPAIGDVFGRQWPAFFTACWLVVPVAAVVMLSLVDKPLLVVRYLMVSLPAAILLVAWVIDRVAARARRGALAVAAVLLVLVLAPLGRRVRAVVLQGRAPGLPFGRDLHCRPGQAGRRRADLPALRAHPGRVVHGRAAGRRARREARLPGDGMGRRPPGLRRQRVVQPGRHRSRRPRRTSASGS